MHRTFKFSTVVKSGLASIMASNMDGVGTFEMAKVLQQHKMLTVLRKHYTQDDWKEAVGSRT